MSPATSAAATADRAPTPTKETLTPPVNHEGAPPRGLDQNPKLRHTSRLC